MTENGGYCCTSDDVKHELCIISTAENEKSYEPGFEISECETRCLNDDLCKGFSIITITADGLDKTMEYCLLYTTSDVSTYCSFNDENLKAELGMNWSVDPLDQNARCVETASIHSHIKMNYYHGCQINLR